MKLTDELKISVKFSTLDRITVHLKIELKPLALMCSTEYKSIPWTVVGHFEIILTEILPLALRDFVHVYDQPWHMADQKSHGQADKGHIK